MKALILASTLALTVLAPVAAQTTPYDNVVKSERKEKAQAAAYIVRAHGYRCDSISSFQPFVMSAGYTIRCNNYRYTYELEDKGGRWVVTVK